MNITLNATSWAHFMMPLEDHRIEVKIQTPNHAVKAYTRISDIPTRSFYNGYFEGSDLDLYMTHNSTGNFLAIFNPDNYKPTKISITVVTNFKYRGIIYWAYLLAAVILSLLFLAGIIKCMELRDRMDAINPETAKSISQDEEEVELSKD
jgi:hypothetical protein